MLFIKVAEAWRRIKTLEVEILYFHSGPGLPQIIVTTKDAVSPVDTLLLIMQIVHFY